MKKLLLFFCCLAVITASALTPFSVNADTKYLRVIDKSTPLFLNENMDDVVCYLPYTYYVALLNELDDCYHVEVFSKNAPSIDGFVKKEQLFYDGLSVNSPCPDVTLSTIEHAPLYADASFSVTQTFIFADRNLSFYGFIKDEQGAFTYLVSYGNKIGYIKEEYVCPFTIENHQNPLTFIKQEDKVTVTDSNAETPNDNAFVFRILVIVCLILAGIIALSLTIKPKKRKDKNHYYDENEYE